MPADDQRGGAGHADERHRQRDKASVAGQIDEPPKRIADHPLESRLEPHLEPGKRSAEPAEVAGKVRSKHARGAEHGQRAPDAHVGRDREGGDHDCKQEHQAEVAEREAAAAVAEVGRKDQLAFDQRKGETADHGGGAHGIRLPDRASGEQQRHEGDDRCDDAERNRDEDPRRAFDGARQLPGTTPLRDVRGLAHHDGVVDEHPEGENEAGHGHRVDRQAEAVDQEDGAKKRNRQSRRDPHGQVRSQEQAQQDENEQQALDAAVEERA